MNVCRFCGDGDGKLIKYGVRHYAHAECGFKLLGDDFLERLALHYVKLLPARACVDAGWPIERLSRYVEKRERDGLLGPINVKRK